MIVRYYFGTPAKCNAYTQDTLAACCLLLNFNNGKK